MEKKNCVNCKYWEAEENNCQIDGRTVFSDSSCESWRELKNKKDREKNQLANSYVPNIWDAWKKKAVLKDLYHENAR